MRSLILGLSACCLALSACAPPGGTGTASASSVAVVAARSALDFGFNSFDTALSGLDFAMDAHLITPGSDKAKSIAAAGRTVLGYLSQADDALKNGDIARYGALFDQAKAALGTFQSLLGKAPSLSSPTGMTLNERLRVLDRAAV